MTATSSWLFLPGRQPAGINPSGSHSAPTAPSWRSATQMQATVDLFDGHSLAPLPGPNVDGLRNGNLGIVTWSKDGKTLYAGGTYHDGRGRPVLAWANAGRGERRALPAGSDTVSGLAALPDGGLLVAAADPFLALLEPDGRPRWVHPSPKADFRNQHDVLAVSADGTIVDFGFEQGGKSPLRFDLRALKLSREPPADQPDDAGKASRTCCRRMA